MWTNAPTSSRARGVARAIAIAALMLTAAVFASACGASNGAPASPTPQVGWYGGIIGQPAARPDFTLTDTSGQSFDFQQQTAGTVTLLYYGYTHCPDVCPTHMATIAGALKDAGPDVASHVKVVFVTTDPERDTGPVLRDWLDHFDANFIGLTGTVREVEAAEAATGMPPAEKTPLENGGYAVSHAAWVTVYAQDDRSHLVYPLSVNQSEWAHDLAKLVKDGWTSS